MQRISPFLWFDTQAEQAAEFYVSLFDDSRITNVSRYGDEAAGTAGVVSVSFVLEGIEFQALNGGPQLSFTEAISLFVTAENQDEIDRLWTALTSDGGEESQCGWLKDRWGLSWQIVPPILGELLADPDASGRVLTAMLGMTKIDIAGLIAARDGE